MIDTLNSNQRNFFSEISIADVINISQTGDILTTSNEKLDRNDDSVFRNFDAYKKAYFSPWVQGKVKLSIKDVIKYFNPDKKIYAENFSLRSQDWFNELKENANLESIGILNLKAMIVNNTSLRNLPTIKPGFYDPRLPGEGFPFDNIQESLLHIGEPVIISHFTKDKSFALVETNTKNFGFVQTNDLSLIDSGLATKILTHDFGMTSLDNVNLYLKNITLLYLNTINLGTLLPIKTDKDSSYDILLPTKGNDGWLTFKTVNVHKSTFIKSPLSFTPTNTAKLIDRLIDKPYGWGGYLQNRDYAQLLKDYFALFGIHMPIFSGDQIKVGNYISLENKLNAEKLDIIKNKAKPFKTLLYRKGHVTLFLGKYNNQYIMFHSVWGVHLYDSQDTEYRYIIGKSIISTFRIW